MSKKKKRAPHQADTRNGRWLGIPHAVLKSEAYRLLPTLSKLLLFSIALRFDGRNNGKIAVSYREFARDLNRKNQAPFAAAIAKLVEHGLIDISLEGSWEARKAREYRLTFVSTGTDYKPVPATNEYLYWRPATAVSKKSGATDGVAIQPLLATPAVATRASRCSQARSNGNAIQPLERRSAATT